MGMRVEYKCSNPDNALVGFVVNYNEEPGLLLFDHTFRKKSEDGVVTASSLMLYKNIDTEIIAQDKYMLEITGAMLCKKDGSLSTGKVTILSVTVENRPGITITNVMPFSLRGRVKYPREKNREERRKAEALEGVAREEEEKLKSLICKTVTDAGYMVAQDCLGNFRIRNTGNEALNFRIQITRI